MPPLEKIGLEAVFDTAAFVKGQRIYETGLERIDSSTTKTAKSLTSAWDDSTAGLEDMFASLDALKGGADDVAAGLAALGTEATAVSASMSAGMVAAGVATAGVAIALAAVAAVGVAIWNKIDDAAMEYLARSEKVIEAQERADEEWDKSSRRLAQILIPLKTELLETEEKIAEAVLNVVDAFGKLVAAAHASYAGIIESLKAIPEALRLARRGEKPLFEDLGERIIGAGAERFDEVLQSYEDASKETFEEIEEDAEDSWDKIVDAVNSALARIEDIQIAHNRRLADLADDYRIRQERAWAKYEQSVAKEINRGQARIAKLGEKYDKRRAKTIADFQKRIIKDAANFQKRQAKTLISFQKRIAKAEEKVSKAHDKAREDFERRERHARERFQLDVLQSERRYQFERSRLVAEGDTLAIEELDARYKLEQEEAKENEKLRQRQTGESQAEQIREAGEAAREQIEELRQQLAETLAEQDANYHEQIEARRQQLAETLGEQEANYQDQVEAQKQANIDRLVEMAAAYQEQQRLADEDYQRSIEKANLNYERQQEDLGRNLVRQEELQELGGEEVERILQRYYGEGGMADRIMESYYERRTAEIAAYAALATQVGKIKPLLPGGIPMPGQEVGMDQGGLITGPATVQVGAGITEAFVPLTGPSAGGAFTHEFMNALDITGLEGASQTDVSRIARELAESLTAKIRTRRRN